MLILDRHVHLYPTELNRDPAGWAAKRGETHWASLCTRQRSDGRPVQGFPEVDDLVREMDRAGVERATLLGWYWEKHETCVWQNRFYGQCVQQHPTRFAAYASFQPRAGHWPTLAEIHRARDDGLTGVGELSPHTQGYGIDDAVFHEILTLASDWKMPVNLHVTDPAGRKYPGRVETPLSDFIALAKQWPTTKFVLSHWGGLLPIHEPSAAKLDNIYYDTAASPLLYDATVWRQMVDAVGADRIVFGSDYPLNLYPKLDAAPTMDRLIAEARGALTEAELAVVMAGRFARSTQRAS